MSCCSIDSKSRQWNLVGNDIKPFTFSVGETALSRGAPTNGSVYCNYGQLLDGRNRFCGSKFEKRRNLYIDGGKDGSNSPDR